ncbi:MAG: 3-isopropylmalate dehydratase small subunit [Phycisphaerales bacterium]
MNPINTVRTPAVVLPDENIDTDRIIPARFLTTTTSDGLGQHAFCDWRYAPDGSPRPEFPFNDPRATGAQILIAGRNFACGSSREHAAWALYDLGVRVVISTEIADIFRANAARNGILPIVVPEREHQHLLSAPFAEVAVDLEACTITPAGAEPFTFTIDAFMRECLLAGVDHLGYLLSRMDEIEAFDARGGAA